LNFSTAGRASDSFLVGGLELRAARAPNKKNKGISPEIYALLPKLRRLETQTSGVFL
jgi:hypothetical protein